MKIIFMVNQYARISGGNRAIFEYANRLKSLGHEIQFFVIAKNIKWYRIDKMLQAFAKGVTTVKPETVDWVNNDINIKILPRNEVKLIPSADILIASAWQTAKFAAQLPPTTGKKFYFIQHHESLWARERETAEQTYRLPFHKIVISSWLKNILMDKYKQESGVLVTPVNPREFFCEEKHWNATRRVCMLHHDYAWKGYRDGIAAINKVRSKNRKFDLVVFGEKLIDPTPLYEEAGFEFEYHYRPIGETLRKIYSSCDIFLCPSWYEGLGMPAMEAMACRCTLVTTDTGGSRDYAIHGETAMVSPSKDINALADNLIAVLDNKPLLERLSENGHLKIQGFDWGENCRQLIEMFENN